MCSFVCLVYDKDNSEIYGWILTFMIFMTYVTDHHQNIESRAHTSARTLPRIMYIYIYIYYRDFVHEDIMI